MTPERWKRIEHLYHYALKRPEGERLAYLHQTCGDDPELLREVIELLRSRQTEDGILRTTALSGVAGDVAQSVDSSQPEGRLISGDAISRLSLSHIPASLIEQAATRLSWVALVCAVTAVIMALMQNLLQPEVAQLQKQLHIRINTAVVICFSLLIFACRTFKWTSARTILRLGLVFEVIVGFALAAFEYSLPWDPQQPVRGISWIALWIALCGLLIPNRLSLMTTATMV